MPVQVHVAGSSSKRLTLGSRVTHRWLLNDRLCVSFSEHPAEIMHPGGRIWAPGGVVIAVSRDATDEDGARAVIEADTNQRATRTLATRWRTTPYRYVQLDWTDGADSFLSGVIFMPELGAVAIHYIANDLGGEYMPRDLDDADPRCLMAHIDVLLGDPGAS